MTPVTADGTVTGSLLWPGAAVDADGNGIAWPGYRAALPGEVADWNGMVLDPANSTYGLIDNPLITFSIDPHETLTVAYPTGVDCTAARSANVHLTKTANVTSIQPGSPFEYTITSQNTGLEAIDSAVMTDKVPSQLHVTKVRTVAAKPGMPDWKSCTITARNHDGSGGTLTCILDRPLLTRQSAPHVILSVYANKDAAVGTITNTADMTADAPATSGLPTMKVNSTAKVASGGLLAFTGMQLGQGLMLALGFGGAGLMFLGLSLIATRRRRAV
jgi:uncharacterized repeat protein (TIGR01451 family)